MMMMMMMSYNIVKTANNKKFWLDQDLTVWPAEHESSILAHELNCILLFVLPKHDINKTRFL
jgi:hypothetical protein